jgi:hypothetical protein
MPRIGFDTDGVTPYVYIETESGGGPTISSTAIGMDATDNNIFKVATAPLAGVTPETATPNISIDPATNGHLTLRPNGTGNIQLADADVTTTGGVLQAAITTGAVSASKGTDGQLLIGNSAGVPVWQNITAGTGITVTNGASSITIAANGSSVVETITGNTGGAISPTAGNINIVTANATPKFAGSGSTETLDFGLNNLALGSSLSSITTGNNNAAYGQDALSAVTDGAGMTAIGYRALRANMSGNSNTAVGTISLLALTSAAGANGYNTALGAAAGYRVATGSYNTLVGPTAGGNYTGAESSNICINHEGVLGDSNTLRIGATTGAGNMSLTTAYICGIDGVNVGSVAKVVTMASDQLGTATITAGTNISVVPTANTITINSTGAASFTWTTVSGTSQAAAVNTGYITDNVGLVTVTLPATAAVGDVIRISGKGSGGWLLAQNGGQTVHFSGSNTTTGGTGSLASVTRYDAVELLCITANTDFAVISSVGNLTIV